MCVCTNETEAHNLCNETLVVNYTGNLEVLSFCYSMLHPNNACRKHLILSFYQR